MGIFDTIKEEKEQNQLEIEIEREVDEFDSPSLPDTIGAAARINIAGVGTFLDMVDRKRVMPANEGQEDYFLTQEYKDVIQNNNVPIEDEVELKDAKNIEYLQAKIANQKRWHEANDVLNEAGGSGLALELGMSLLDPISWIAGGGVMKGFKLAATANRVQGRALTALNIMGGVTTGAVAVGVSESLIQTSAGIKDQERLNTMIGYASALGLAIPLLVPTIKTVSSGASRVSSATGLTNMVDNIIQPNGFSRFFAISSANQMNNSKIPFSRDIGDKAVTRVRAQQTTDGEFITKSDDTAMDVRQEIVDNNINHIEQNVSMRAKANNINNATQAAEDGAKWSKFTNGVEQDVRAKMLKMSDDEIFEMYAEQTGKKVTDATEDLYDVVGAVMSKKGFDDGIYKAPKDLGYIEQFYSNFGKRATTAELGGIAGKDSRGYGHIKYNPQYILSIGNVAAEAKFANMLRNDNLNRRLLEKGEMADEDILVEAKRLVEKAMDRDISRRYLDKGGDGSTSATKRRVLRLDRSLHPEMFVNDIGVIANEYADNIGGKIAMKEVYGMQADASGSITKALDDTYRKIETDGSNLGLSQREIKRDIDNAKAIFETVLGTRKYTKDTNAFDPFFRHLKKGANALYSAGFVRYGVVEPTVAIARFGLPAVIRNFVPAFRRVQEQISSAKPKDPIVKLARYMGVAGQTLRGIRYDRYDNMEITPTVSKTEMFLDQASHYSRKFSGFNYVNDVSDMISGGAAMDELFTIIGKNAVMSKQEASRMARFGLTSKEIKAIGKEKAIKYADDGVVSDFNIENWKDPELAKKTIRYMQRAVTDTIMRADGTRVHRWQSDNTSAFRSMMLQYTQMPTVLYERLLLNGMDEASARTAIGFSTSIGMMYMIMDLEDRAEVAAGIKAKHDSQEMIFVKAVTRTPFAGIVPNFIDAGRALSGQAPLGSNFAPRSGFSAFGGAGVNVAEKVFRLTSGLGDGINDKDAVNALKLVPIINSLPIFKQALGFLIGDSPGEPYKMEKPAMDYIFEESEQ